MPAIYFGKGAYRRTNGNLPELRLVNMYAESTPTESDVVLLGRPGLELSRTIGGGSIKGLFSQEGTFDGDLFAVSGSALYRGETLLGLIDGTGPVSFAASDLELVVTAGGTAYSYNGTNLAAIAFPDGANVAAVAFAAGLFLYARAESHRYYWSAVLDGRTVGALDYASAELRPDYLLDIQVVRGNPYLLGQQTIEPWFPTGVADLPFNRMDQRLMPRGVLAGGCAVEMDNTLFFIGNDGIVYRLGDVPDRISDHGIEERIEASSGASCYGFVHEGHSFFCIRLSSGTFTFDAATGQWCEFASYGRDNFRARCAATSGRTVLLGDDSTGKVWTFTETPTDDGGTLESLFTAGFPIKGGAQSINNVGVEANVGWTEFLAGQGENPVIEMRASRDAGATWGNWRSANLGAQGRYRTRARWTRLGMFDPPGGLMEFRITDPAPRRVSGVYVNEPGGGRGR